MADIRSTWDAAGQRAVWLLSGADLAADDGLETAVLLSLFTDATATAEEMAAAGVSVRRGWWADAYAGDVAGSKLWLLTREKALSEVVERARGYATEALQWLVDDGVVESVAVDAEAQGEVLALEVTITRRGEPAQQYRFDSFWRGI